jgi:demethoxyubiquinone hydroxylase (CLK1/Coq7/Cat5 family)
MPTFVGKEENQMQNTTQKTTVDTLNGFLRGEISAVETYRQALDKLQASPSRMQLEQCRGSHEQRVERLRQEVVRLGGQPEEGSGAWGAFARVVEGSAKVLGEKAAISALEEGEDRGLKLYRDEIGKLDATARSVIESEVLPAQERTHQSLSTLKHSLH